MSTRDLDIVVFGATGFTGALIAEYLAGRHEAAETKGGGPLRVGLAGRSIKKLEAVLQRVNAVLSKRSFAEGAPVFSLLEADVGDKASVLRVAERTHVLLSTVGPFASHGLPIVQACAESGTHYCDITGEPHFIRASIDACDEIAQKSGARIVHTCGFDSIPSDLGMCVLHEFLKEQGEATELLRATLGVLSMKGTFSGGTAASVTELLQLAASDRKIRRLLADPYGLSPNREAEPNLGREADLVSLEHDAFLGRWVAPFVMASVNTRVVRRSNALLGHAYGRTMRYREVTVLKRGPLGFLSGSAAMLGLGALVVSQKFGVTRQIARRMLPKPGEGPDEAARNAGSFRLRIEAENAAGKRFRVHVAGTSDPGYGETAKMAGESALCLLRDQGMLPKRAGVLTPAAAMGMPLVSRLRNAGMTFEASQASP
jgi:short subunit dehydrogenase-like uncharacterized protein